MRTIYIHLLVHAAMPINQLKSYLVHTYTCSAQITAKAEVEIGKRKEQSNHESWDIRYVQKMDINSLKYGNAPWNARCDFLVSFWSRPLQEGVVNGMEMRIEESREGVATQAPGLC